MIIEDKTMLPVGQLCHTTATGIRLGCAHVRTERQADAISGPYRNPSRGDWPVMISCALAAMALVSMGLLGWL